MGITQDYDVIKCEKPTQENVGWFIAHILSAFKKNQRDGHVFFSDDKAGASLIVISMMPITF